MQADPDGRRNVLVLFWHPQPGQMLLAIRQHLTALEASPLGHRITYLNFRDPVPRWIRKASFDAVILHTTLLCLRWHDLFYVMKGGLDWLAALDALKIAMPQDEYDHSEVLDEWLCELGVDVVFTNFGEEHREVLYPVMSRRARFRRCLTGYISEDVSRISSSMPPHADRPFDVVYSASRLPYYFGSHAQLKHRIGVVASEAAAERGLKANIRTGSMQDLITGDAWLKFLGSGRGVVGCESGASALNRRGEMSAAVDAMLAHDPDLSFDACAARLPAGWDSYDFRAISPRHLEAVATRTAQVLVAGRYDGILDAGRHYIPVRADLSDLGDALEQLRDPVRVRELTESAYEDVVLSKRYSYQGLATMLDDLIVERPRGRVATRFFVSGETRAPHPGLTRQLLSYLRAETNLAPAAFKVIRREPVLRDVLFAYASDRRLRSSVRIEDLLDDLLRIGIALKARQHRLTAGEDFELRLIFEAAQRRVRLVSVAEGQPSGDDVEGLDAALESRDVQSVIWDHAKVGMFVYERRNRRSSTTIPIANGIHVFGALADVGKHRPDLQAAVLRALLEREHARGLAEVASAAWSGGLPLVRAATPVGPTRSLLMRPWLARRMPRGFLADLAAWSILIRVATGHQTAGVPFRLGARLSADGSVLTLRSVDVDADASSVPPEDLVAAVRDNRLQRITWDHTAIGESVHHRLSATRWLTLPVGERGVREFRALPALGRVDPGRLTRLLMPVAGGDAIGNHLLGTPLRDPRGFAGRLYLVGELIARDPASRLVLGRYLRDRVMRRTVPLSAVLEDLLTLRLARRAVARGLDGVFASATEEKRSRLVFKSGCEQPAARAVRRESIPRRLVWDNSPIGEAVLCPLPGGRRVTVHVGRGGVHQFPALALLAPAIPDHEWRELVGLV